MEFLSGLGTGIGGYVLPFLVALTVVVFVHELGHYAVARLCGVRVEVFSIGFGPEMFGITDRHGTRWKFSLVPLGGYVKMFGDRDAASTPGEPAVAMTPEERAVAFPEKSVGRRAAIVAAGPIANVLFSILVFAGLFATVGEPYTPPEIGVVDPDSAADKAGIRPGDRILSVNGRNIDRFEDLRQIVQIGLGAPLDMVVKRDGAELRLAVTPVVVDQTDSLGNKFPIGLLGVKSRGYAYTRHDPATALWRGVAASWAQVEIAGKAIGQMIEGTRTTKEIGGPLRIAWISGEVAKGGVLTLISFMAILSVNLGLINVVPIPILDGGHLLFYAAEAVRGRPLGARAQEYGFRIGLALVLVLFVVATWNDLVHLRVVQFIQGLIT
ncbi:MAG: RIP metalloprotease RseP [Alphaproteobacteria bacterium]